MGCSAPFSNLESCASYKRKKGTEIERTERERIESRHGKNPRTKEKAAGIKDFSGDFQGDSRSLKASEEIIHQEFFITFSLLYFLNYHLIFCFNYGFLVFCNCVFDFEHG